MDVHSKAVRSFNMSRIRSTNTKPEMLVRSLIHRLGYRFRLHRSDLPGKPDLVFVSKRKVIFVHGCFWHFHRCRYGRVSPKSNIDFRQAKRTGNKTRDLRNNRRLHAAGWQVLTIWECEMKNVDRLVQKLLCFLVE